jgi:hypothetical protein
MSMDNRTLRPKPSAETIPSGTPLATQAGDRLITQSSDNIVSQ